MKIAILGPTASGKSGLAVEVARRVGGAVVNGDPFQSIAGLPIGTGQPSDGERGGVPHLGYGLLPISTRPNPADFGKQVREWLGSSRDPVLVTGSGLYLRGIWGQLSDLPEVGAATVQRVRGWSGVLGVPRLHRVLSVLDPARAAEVHPNDGSRITRALALHLATGRKPSDLLSAEAPRIPEGWRVLVVQPTREMQRLRIRRRVEAQAAAGWKGEVEKLLEGGFRADLEALRPLGYAAWMEGGAPEEIQARIVQETQNYAKRQATWFRHQVPDAPRWDPDEEPLSAAMGRLGLT